MIISPDISGNLLIPSLLEENLKHGMSIKSSQTEKNLLKAFAGESQARNRYTYFASAARKEGLEQIANIFSEIFLSFAAS